jgi:hypothetical protein
VLSAHPAISPGPYHWRVRTTPDSPFFPRSRWFSIQGNGPEEQDLKLTGESGVGPSTPQSASLRIESCRPNPFESGAAIVYDLPRDCHVSLAIYDVHGRRVMALVDRIQGAGSHTAFWKGAGRGGVLQGSGVYLVRLEAGNEVRTGKLILLRR